MNKQERKEAIRIGANESKLWDCLNSAVDNLGRFAPERELKKEAIRIYKKKGFSNLPFLNRQKVFKQYF